MYPHFALRERESERESSACAIGKRLPAGRLDHPDSMVMAIPDRHAYASGNRIMNDIMMITERAIMEIIMSGVMRESRESRERRERERERERERANDN